MGSFALALSTLLFAAPGAAPSPTPSPAPAPTGEEIIRRMHDRYAGKWYRTLTFTQRTTLPDGHVETWHEAMALPGKLRIDIAPLDSMEALIFRAETVRKLRDLGFDLSKVHETRWQGRKTYVVGAEVLFFSGGDRRVTEEYSDIRVDVPVDETTFDPSSYRATGWVR